MQTETETGEQPSELGPIRLLVLFLVFGAVLVADQMTKSLVQGSIAVGETIPVIPGFFNLVLTYNLGVAFGLFSGLESGVREWVLLGAKFLAFGVVFFLMRSELGRSRSAQYGFALILGGAFGNIIDRLRIGAVIDFLDFYIGTAHWPAFNVADSAICIGVGLLLLSRPPGPRLADQR